MMYEEYVSNIMSYSQGTNQIFVTAEFVSMKAS